MDDVEIIAAFRARRAHYDTWLQANDVPFCTCPGCGFPTLQERCDFEICAVCNWEDDGQDDNSGSILDELQTSGIRVSGPNGHLTLTENRINIGRKIEVHADLMQGEVDTDTGRVIQKIAFYRQRKSDISDRMTGDEHIHDHIWIEWKEVSKDLLMELMVPKETDSE
ncbi:CPCC family cysteine-rich protein [Chitinophaga caseinilytica]|uniref:CPCC family cysteine-rich protein n=1 Tax=Chitinophaga caseinilytica TaxID=2267521 RepID=UPI003C2E1A24